MKIAAKSLLRDLFGSLRPWGKFWLLVGLGVLGAAVAMSFDFGYSVSLKHAVFLAFLSVVTAFAPLAAELLWQEGRKFVVLAIAIICAPLFAIEFYSHAGYTAGLRGSNIGNATVQNVKYSGAQEAVVENKTNLEMWKKRLAELEAQNAWVATVTADALRAKMASAQLAIDLEAARKGCKSKCLERTKERDALAAQIAIAEEKANLTKQIEGTKKVLDGSRATAASTERKFSAAEEQNKAAIKWVALVYNGSTEASSLQAEATEQMANLGMAIAGTGLPAFALFLAGLFRRREDEAHHYVAPVDHSPAIHAMQQSRQGQPGTQVIHVKDSTLREWAGSCKDDISAMLSGPQLAGAR